MSTIPVTNLTDTPVAGETDLRQAITQAHNGDTIVLASGDFGELIQLKSRLIVSAGANLTIDFGAGEDNGIDGSIMVDAGRPPPRWRICSSLTRTSALTLLTAPPMARAASQGWREPAVTPAARWERK